MAKDKSGTKGGPAALDRSPSHLLRRALQLSLDIYGEAVGVGGITQRQYAVLAATHANEGATQADLVRTTGIDRSTLAEMAGRMKAKGLLEQERSSKDARANALRLTDEGQAALEAARPMMDAADARLLKLLPRADRDRFMVTLRDLLAAGEAAAHPAPETPAKAEKPPKGEGKKKKKSKKAA